MNNGKSEGTKMSLCCLLAYDEEYKNNSWNHIFNIICIFSGGVRICPPLIILLITVCFAFKFSKVQIFLEVTTHDLL